MMLMLLLMGSSFLSYKSQLLLICQPPSGLCYSCHNMLFRLAVKYCRFCHHKKYFFYKIPVRIATLTPRNLLCHIGIIGMQETTHMALTLGNLKKVRATNPPRCLFYGMPGRGKTTLGAEFPAPAFLQFEEGETTDMELTPFRASSRRPPFLPTPQSKKCHGQEGGNNVGTISTLGAPLGGKTRSMPSQSHTNGPTHGPQGQQGRPLEPLRDLALSA
ncbi:hypothetical protein GQE99_06510 [Maritimibacter sp. DP07]|uniref:Uncharacterized protein n=1 Tax=Maritimibacter harenae TaxID=2606218 RepID=A0A845M8P0_9RHOB|nr:hypothetical protein [Maritimibacter harenae]